MGAECPFVSAVVFASPVDDSEGEEPVGVGAERWAFVGVVALAEFPGGGDEVGEGVVVVVFGEGGLCLA